MKKIFLFSIVLLIVLILTGCSNDPKFLNDPIDFIDSEVVTELDLSEVQLEFLLDNNIRLMIEVENGFIVVYYETDRTINHITYLTNDIIDWTIGPYSSVSYLEVKNESEFIVTHCVELRICSTSVFNMNGEQLITVNANNRETHELSNGNLLAAHQTDTDYLNYYHSYDLVIASVEGHQIIKELVDIRSIYITQLLDDTYLISTYDLDGKRNCLKITELGDIVFDYELEDNEVFDFLIEGLIFYNKYNNEIYKVDKYNNEIWNISIEYERTFLEESNDEYTIISIFSDIEDIVIKVFNDGTYIPIQNYISNNFYPNYFVFENNDVLGLFRHAKDYLALYTEDQQEIWIQGPYNNIMDVTIIDDYYMVYAFDVDSNRIAVKVDFDGNELFRYDVLGKVFNSTSDGGYIGKDEFERVIKYDSNFNVEWKSDTYNYVDYINETDEGNFLISYPEYYNYSQLSGSTLTNLISSDGNVIQSYDNIYSSLSFALIDNGNTYLTAYNADESGIATEQFLVNINEKGDIVSEDRLIFKQYYDGNGYAFILRDNKLIRIKLDQ